VNAPVAIILAAGKSTRMKSELPKVIHEINGRPMINYVLDVARTAGCERIIVIVGHKAELIQEALKNESDVEFAFQIEQHGTGHAVMMCKEQLKDHNGPVLILAGDTPLLKAETLTGLLNTQKDQNAVSVIGSATTDNNHGLGRIVRDENQKFVKIVEQKDTTAEEDAIKEINTGCYAFDCQSLLSALDRLQPNNKQGEFYLTDCPAILKEDGKTVAAADIFDIEEAMGVNTQEQLAEVAGIIKNRG
jgi:bifunctional UDP-N-acetylglucosamine pyrophosphorylase / glucosamine-1-phosphate N-acetyltransferase